MLWLVAFQQANAFLFEECGMEAGALIDFETLHEWVRESMADPLEQGDRLQYQLAKIIIGSIRSGHRQTWRLEHDKRFPYEFSAVDGVLEVKGICPEVQIPKSKQRYATRYIEGVLKKTPPDKNN